MRISLLAATALAFALPVAAQASSAFDGFYVGAQIGGAFTNIEQDQGSLSYNGGIHKSDSNSANGLVGGVFGGYGQTVYGNIYLGGEADVTFGNREYTDSYTDPTDPSQNNLKTGTEWGMSLRPGYVLNDKALVYGLLGFQRTPLKSTSSDIGALTFNKTQTAFRIGLGAEVQISGPLTFRGDYTHVFLDKITISDGVLGDSIAYKPSEDVFKLGIAYHF